MSSSSDEQFCLQWNDFQQCIKTTFTDLRAESDFMDVTLFCEGGQQVMAHKVVLSACSLTFRQLLKSNPGKHPVIVLWDVRPWDLGCLLDFMYQGQVNVKQDNLKSFLALAERLKVRGLCQDDDGNPGEMSSKTSTPRKVQQSKSRSLDTHSGPLLHESPSKINRDDTDEIKGQSLPELGMDEEAEDDLLPPPEVKMEAEVIEFLNATGYSDGGNYEEDFAFMDGSHGANHQTQGKKPRKSGMRTVFSKEQLSQLEAEFQIKKYLSASERIRIAEDLGLNESQVQIWFQNRRKCRSRKQPPM